MVEHWLTKPLKHKLSYRRGVHLTGARQVRKSTLANHLPMTNCRRYTLDVKNIRDVAMIDPYGFVKHASGETIIIDEIQKVLELLEAIKIILDKDDTKGQYLLTRSSNLHFAKAIKDSLAGRLVTVQTYLETLKALYLFDAIPSQAKSDYELLGKRTKWIATDSEVMASLLHWNDEETYFNELQSGEFIESWVYQQLAAIEGIKGGYEITHYKDNKQREIDFMIEREDGYFLAQKLKQGVYLLATLNI